jgi:hypothetical protein
MKSIIIFIHSCIFFSFAGYAQVIPFGTSADSINY